MFYFKHRTLIAISGLIWLVIGAFLLSLGLHFILDTIQANTIHNHFSIIDFLNVFVEDSEQSALVLIVICLVLGYIKGRFILSKSVKRQIIRIMSLPNPANLKSLYGKGYYLLLLIMIGFGFIIRYLPISLDTRGAVDLTIGSALVNGALIYLRFATTLFSTIKEK